MNKGTIGWVPEPRPLGLPFLTPPAPQISLVESEVLDLCLILTPAQPPPEGPPQWPGPTLTLQHASVGPLGHRIHVRWHLVALLAPVHLHDRLRVDGKLLVWVDDHTEKAGVRLRWAQAGEGLSCLPTARQAPRGYCVQLGRVCMAQGHSLKGCHLHHGDIDLNLCYKRF